MTDRAFFLPPEWAPQRAVWFTWPQNADTWTPVWEDARKAYETVIGHALRFQDVVLTASTPELKAELDSRLMTLRGGKPHKLEIVVCPTNDSWIRDYGGQTVRGTNPDGSARPVLLSFGFNSWGGKYPPWNADNAVPDFMARHRGYERVDVPMILEGGSIDVNGEGLLLTTESCLLNPNRNPSYTKRQIEETLTQAFGLREVLWLESGIDGDDTDGHIDDLARFTDARTVVCAVESDPADENFDVLRRNAERLQEYAARLDFRVIEVPMPGRQVRAGLRTPATYMNFLILNGAVLLPVFDDPRDAATIEVFKELFPGREIVPVDCRALVYGQGAIHCSSMQEAKIE
ncbi:MAG TPA: agmatine deiminase family protein [Fibrobacteria bacterium]|nr:agmatine deiminase family protein [Fibrobacteria bacterium]